MSGSTNALFIGGPLDGEVRALEDPPQVLRVALHPALTPGPGGSPAPGRSLAYRRGEPQGPHATRYYYEA